MYKDAAGNYSDIVSVKEGTSIINVLVDTNDRWGDYTNIQRRYNMPNRAYLSGSWGKSTTMNCWVAMIETTDYPLATTGVQQVSQLELYPNPVQAQRFKTRFTNLKEQKLAFDLYDAQGRMVQRVLNTRLKPGIHEFSISTATLSGGTYFLSIHTEKEVLHHEKVIVP